MEWCCWCFIRETQDITQQLQVQAAMMPAVSGVSVSFPIGTVTGRVCCVCDVYVYVMYACCVSDASAGLCTAAASPG